MSPTDISRYYDEEWLLGWQESMFLQIKTQISIMEVPVIRDRQWRNVKIIAEDIQNEAMRITGRGDWQLTAEPGVGPVKVKGEKHIGSNFYCGALFDHGIILKSGEHWYQGRKADFVGDYSAFENILRKETPSAAKAEGKKIDVQGRGWDATKISVVDILLFIKLDQTPGFRRFLLSTGNRHISHPVNDLFWGSLNRGQIQAQNEFGKSLIRQRNNLRGIDPPPTYQAASGIVVISPQIAKSVLPQPSAPSARPPTTATYMPQQPTRPTMTLAVPKRNNPIDPWATPPRQETPFQPRGSSTSWENEDMFTQRHMQRQLHTKIQDVIPPAAPPSYSHLATLPPHIEESQALTPYQVPGRSSAQGTPRSLQSEDLFPSSQGRTATDNMLTEANLAHHNGQTRGREWDNQREQHPHRQPSSRDEQQRSRSRSQARYSERSSRGRSPTRQSTPQQRRHRSRSLSRSRQAKTRRSRSKTRKEPNDRHRTRSRSPRTQQNRLTANKRTKTSTPERPKKRTKKTNDDGADGQWVECSKCEKWDMCWGRFGSMSSQEWKDKDY